METAEVVIIGGGVVGTSIAYHLARQGCRGVLLLEKEPLLGTESTGACVGGIRFQFSTEVNIRLSLESRNSFLCFQEELGCDIGYRQHGYLFLATNPKVLGELKSAVLLQQELGVPSEFLSPQDVSELVPLVDVRDVLGASNCPWDGSADPYQVTQGYAREAKRLGVKFSVGREVTGIMAEDGIVQGVITPQGKISTRVVINSAGPYGDVIGKMAGVKLPMAPFRRQVFLAQHQRKYPDGLPLVVDTQAEFYFKQETEGFLLGRNIHEPSSFQKNLDWSSLDAVVEAAVQRVPDFQEARIARGWAGLRSITPDSHAILGEISGARGFFCAVGFSGHGFMHAPITGRLMAELVMEGRTSSLDISPFHYKRFEERDFSREAHVF